MTETPFKTPYPSYNVLDKWDTPSWNDQTRRVVADRLENVPRRRFLSDRDYALLRAVVDTALPQPERSEAERVPVEAFIDAMLHDNVSDGTRYADVPTAREAWRRGLPAIEAEARRRHGRGFRMLTAEEKRDLFRAIDAGDVDEATWQGVSPKRFFRSLLLTWAVKVYYAHPQAWSEMGFGGPASPRGYVRLGPDDRDPWEAREERAPQKLKEPS
jgi:hypothetical protein